MGYPRGYSAAPRNTLGISHTPQLPWGLSITCRIHAYVRTYIPFAHTQIYVCMYAYMYVCTYTSTFWKLRQSIIEIMNMYMPLQGRDPILQWSPTHLSNFGMSFPVILSDVIRQLSSPSSAWPFNSITEVTSEHSFTMWEVWWCGCDEHNLKKHFYTVTWRQPYRPSEGG